MILKQKVNNLVYTSKTTCEQIFHMLTALLVTSVYITTYYREKKPSIISEKQEGGRNFPGF